MTIRFVVLGFFSFMAGALTMFVLARGPELMLAQPQRPVPATRETVSNEEFEAVEQRLRDIRDPEWNLLQDMQPCFPGSRLCFLLSDNALAAGSDR
jgi:hypothetical protein